MFDIKKVNVNLTTIVSSEPESDVPCGACTMCCQLLSPHLTPDEVDSGKYPISLVNATPEIYAVDPAVGPIITMFKNKTGGCTMLIDNRCSIYEDRPRACRIFDCRKGHHPKTNGVLKDSQ